MGEPRHQQQQRARGQGGGYRGGDRGGRGREQASLPALKVDDIRFSGDLDPELFNGIAKRCAATIGANKKRNKPSQLRRFYDELVMWQTKVGTDDARFQQVRPFILMLNAKAAYAEGRELVDKNFVALLERCLRQAEDARTLGYAKLFFEAFLGFYKEERPGENK
ncbi:type III-A CRISPR-associated protein Csm2 [Halochromatium glycolicum]|uniref:CRISPR system Cms protein Csm2 n=1 Tax=Halochromatium glycolicum TaxID=85075 RepID=A0AAJ0U315_9GAMM|nr:type III-A CRISPR-associated protein Csm2 [Halochromatium glycolicum]MBK1704364.1 type III-A CRISPR-associated protein Csm2 [Halochromatium glycolicum]